MTTRMLTCALTMALYILCFNGMNAQCIKSDPKVEAQIEEILSKMNLDDKVGQMCELTFDVIANKFSNNNAVNNKATKTLADGLISAEALNRVFGEYKVGSILNIPQDIAQTPEVWSNCIRVLNSTSAFHCNGIPQIHGVDQIHGASYSWGATLFPHEIGQGASFNRQIPKRIGHITAYESRACLIPWVYSPVMDLARSPLWPRMWESFGEDVLLNSLMAVELTKGLQGDDPNHIGMNNVAACLKHFMAYGASVSGKDRTPSSIAYRELMEKYFQPFRMCCEAGALSIMVSSGNNAGMPFHANRKLLTEWIKQGLDWDGMIVTDWADIDNLWKRDRCAETRKDAICMAINAGIDMSMTPYSTEFCTLLKQLVEEGKVPQSRIDDAVRRILRLKIRVGLLDHTTWDIPYVASKKSKNAASLKTMYSDFGSEKFDSTATKIAEECIVLLKNKASVLPIAKGKKIFVCGPNANNFRPMNGGWSYTWQGHKTDSVCRRIGKYHTFYDAIAEKFGKENVEFSEMVAYDGEGGSWQNDHVLPELLNETGNSTADKISRSDVIVACIGENSYTESVGNIDDLTLSANQIEMVKSLEKYGKPIVLVLNEGRPRIISTIEPLASAVVQTFLPGNYGGDALANLLSGDVNFSAKLPYTYPKYHGSFITYDCKPCEYAKGASGGYDDNTKTAVQWPFGYGLSYSDVRISNLRITSMPKAIGTRDVADSKAGMSPRTAAGPQYNDSDKIQFSFDVTNNSDRDVKEPVLLYISDLVASLTPDVKRLRSFKKVTLAPHETKSVTLGVRPSDLSFVNEDMRWVLEPGTFRVTVGDQSLDFSINN